MVSLAVLYSAAIWLMSRTGMSMLTPRQMMSVLWLTWRGRALMAAVAVWAAVYPRVGFVRRRLSADYESDRERIMNAFVRSGYVLVREEGRRMTFRAAGPLHRLRLLFEDEVTLADDGDGVTVEGIRRSVAEIAMRLNTYVQNAKRDEKE